MLRDCSCFTGLVPKAKDREPGNQALLINMIVHYDLDYISSKTACPPSACLILPVVLEGEVMDHFL